MIRKIFSLLVITVFITSCGNTGTKETAVTDGTGSAEKVEFATLIGNPESFVGKNLIIEGKVVHVCTHTGKKMFIVGENPDVRLFITAGEEVAKFPMELMGSVITVEGSLSKVVSPAKPEGEVKMNADSTKKMTGEACETEAAVAAQPMLADLVLNYKSHSVK